eukprot:COSAG02_NODE_4316_length_5512_cov_72.504188_6_plen_125_part_00
MAGPVTIVSVLPGLGAGSRKYWALMMARITQQYAACTHGRAPSRIVALSRCAVVPLAGRLLGGMRTWVSVVGPRASDPPAVRIPAAGGRPGARPCACRPGAAHTMIHAYQVLVVCVHYLRYRYQ